MLVCARSLTVRPILPGAFPNVIGMDVDWDLPRHRYRIANADAKQGNVDAAVVDDITAWISHQKKSHQ